MIQKCENKKNRLSLQPVKIGHQCIKPAKIITPIDQLDVCTGDQKNARMKNI